MFNSVIASPMSLTAFLICELSALLLGFLAAVIFTRGERHSGAYAQTLALLPPVVALVIMLVNGNIGAGLAVAGTFALVRFRSAPGSAKEITGIFFAVALGLDDAKAPEGYEPADQAVVVLTQHRAYQKPLDCEKLAIRTHRYDKFPYYLDALKTRGQRYNNQREQLFELEKQGKLLVIAPEKPVTVSVAEKDGAPLLDLYFQGRNQTLARLDEIRAFISA